MTRTEQANRAFFQKASEHFYYFLYEKESLYPEARLEEGEHGLKIARGGGRCYIDSVYDKEAEYADLLRGVTAETRQVVIFGAGSLDIVEYLIRRFKKVNQIFIVEPANQVMREILRTESFPEALKKAGKARVTLLVNMEAEIAAGQIASVIDGSTRPALCFKLAQRTLFGDYYAELQTLIADEIRRKTINVVTRRSSINLWLNHTIRNFALPAYPAEIIEPLVRGRPVVMVSAGPSLKKNMRLLDAARDKAVVVAVGTAVEILNKAGIRPHFNAGYDAFQGSQFDHLRYPDAPLLFGSQLDHRTAAAYTGPRLHIQSNTDHLGIYLYRNKREPRYITSSGPSVANLIHDFFCRLGCGMIIFTGQDMCLYDKKLYAAGEDVEDDDLLERLDIYGETVQTPPGYWSIKVYLERIAKSYPEITAINATEGGLGVEGAANMTLKEALEGLPAFETPLTEQIQALLDARRAQRVVAAELFETEKVMEDVDRVHKSSVEMLRGIAKIGALQKNRAHKSKIRQVLQKLRERESALNELPFYRDVVAVNLQGIMQGLKAIYENDCRAKDPERRLAAAIRLYAGVGAETKCHCELIRQLYEEMNEISKNTQESAGEADV